MTAASRLQDETAQEWKKRAGSQHAEFASDPGRDWVLAFLIPMAWGRMNDTSLNQDRAYTVTFHLLTQVVAYSLHIKGAFLDRHLVDRLASSI